MERTPSHTFLMARQLHSSDILPRCIQWLNTRTPPDYWAFVYVDGRERALDLTRAIARGFHGEHTATTIEFDNPPTCIINKLTGFKLFVVTQPDHLTTIQSTMTAEPIGVWRNRMAGSPGAKVRGAMGYDLVDQTDLIATAAPADQIMHEARLRGKVSEMNKIAYLRKPVEIMVDVELPPWTAIGPYAGNHTTLMETDRVHTYHTALATKARIQAKVGTSGFQSMVHK